jgi:hypothetical protein
MGCGGEGGGRKFQGEFSNVSDKRTASIFGTKVKPRLHGVTSHNTAIPLVTAIGASYVKKENSRFLKSNSNAISVSTRL